MEKMMARELLEKDCFVSSLHDISSNSEDFSLPQQQTSESSPSDTEIGCQKSCIANSTSKRTSVDSDDFCLFRLFDEDCADHKSVFRTPSLSAQDNFFAEQFGFNVDHYDEERIENAFSFFRCGICLLTGTELRHQRISWKLRKCRKERLEHEGVANEPYIEVLCDICKREYVTLKIKQGFPFIECPTTLECGKFVDDSEVKEVVSDELFERYQKLRVDMKADPLKKACPYCSKIYGATSKRERKVLCSACYKTWCFSCHGPWHEGITCKEFLKDDQSLKIWAKNKGKLKLFRNARRCPKCKVLIQRCEGCQRVTCIRCYTEFCFLCGGRFWDFGILGYHFSRFSLLGCKYEFKPNNPVQRIATRGVITTGYMLFLPVAAGILLGAGCIGLAGLVIASPVLVPYCKRKIRRQPRLVRNALIRLENFKNNPWFSL